MAAPNIDLGAVRTALATVLDAVTGVRAYAQVPGTIVTSSEANTAVLVVPGEPYVDYAGALNGGCAEVNLEVQILVQMADLSAAQTRLDSLLGKGTGSTRSLYDAILGNRTLSGAVTACEPPLTAGGVTTTPEGWLAAKFEVNILICA